MSLKRATILVVVGLIALFVPGTAQAYCKECAYVIVVDMSGNPIGFAEECVNSERQFLSYSHCERDRYGYCLLSGNRCFLA